MSSIGSQIGSVHAASMHWRAARSALLAENLANAETPGYRAKDLDFSSFLQELERPVSTTDQHPVRQLQGEKWVYRNPLHPALDRNAVDTQQEYAAFSENAVRYMASFHFLSQQFKYMLTAIRGG